MIRFSHATSVAIAAACLFAVPAAAQNRELVFAHVATAGLDLRSPAGIAQLKGRLHRAALSACENGARDLASITDAERCRTEMEQDGRLKLAALIQSNDVQVAGR